MRSCSILSAIMALTGTISSAHGYSTIDSKTIQPVAEKSNTHAKGHKPITDAQRSMILKHLDGMGKLGKYVASARPSAGVARAQTTSATPPSPPPKLDFRTYVSGFTPIMTPIKNQNVCGSCWTFATTEILESAFARRYSELNVLAPQLLVSCASDDYVQSNVSGTLVPVPGFSLAGCGGGHALLALHYLAGGRWLYVEALEELTSFSVSPRPMIPELLYPYVEAAWPSGTGCAENEYQRTHWGCAYTNQPNGCQENVGMDCTSKCDTDRANVVSSVDSITNPTYLPTYLVSRNGLTFVDTVIPFNVTEFGILPDGSINGGETFLAWVNWNIQAFLDKYGPVAIAISDVPAFGDHDYLGQEVLTTKQCAGAAGTTSSSILNHAVVLAGYTEVNGIPAWIIRNSWTTEWGDRGYAYFAMDGNVCGFMHDMVAVTVIGDPTINTD